MTIQHIPTTGTQDPAEGRAVRPYTPGEDFTDHSPEDMIAGAPAHLQGSVREALNLLNDNDRLTPAQISRGLTLCSEVLAEQPDYDVMDFLRAAFLLERAKPEDLTQAFQILREMAKTHSRDEEFMGQFGIACFKMGRLKYAVKVFSAICPLKRCTDPTVYLDYGCALEMLERSPEAVKWYRMNILDCQKSGIAINPYELLCSFCQVLPLEILYERADFEEDLPAFEALLLQYGPLNSHEQELLSQTVVRMSTLLARAWLRPLFRAFVTFLDHHSILQGPLRITIYTAYYSVDSYDMCADDRVSSFVEDYFGNVAHAYEDEQAELYDPDFTLTPPSPQDLRMHQLSRLVYEWYMVRYARTHQDEMLWVRDTYPQSWPMLEKYAAVPQSSVKRTQDQLVNRMAVLAAKNRIPTDKWDIAAQLEQNYQRAISYPKEHFRDPDAPDTAGGSRSPKKRRRT